jgi:hypothetical protein
MSKVSKEKAADDKLAAEARTKADAWARSVPGTPYGTTEPVLTGELTEFQRTHPHEAKA